MAHPLMDPPAAVMVSEPSLEVAPSETLVTTAPVAALHGVVDQYTVKEGFRGIEMAYSKDMLARKRMRQRENEPKGDRSNLEEWCRTRAVTADGNVAHTSARIHGNA